MLNKSKPVHKTIARIHCFHLLHSYCFERLVECSTEEVKGRTKRVPPESEAKGFGTLSWVPLTFILFQSTDEVDEESILPLVNFDFDSLV